MNIKFKEHDVTTMHAESAAVRERVHKPTLLRERAASHKLEQIRHPRLLEKLATWKRDDDFDRNEILAEMHRRNIWRLYSGDDPKHFQVRKHYGH